VVLTADSVYADESGRKEAMNMSRSRLVALLAILLLAALPALAKVNFSGDWKLNVSKSDFGQMPAPSSMTQKVTHEDPKLKVAVKSSSERGDFEYEMNYTTDGQESTNEIRGNPMKSIVKWDGDVLVIESKGRFGDNEFTMRSRWTLSADGKTLTIENHFSSAMGEGDQKQVLEKQ
jgi:hypothetical protein